MDDRLDALFQQWARLGAPVLLAVADAAAPTRRAECLVAESTAYCRDSGRLTWVVLDWLVRHVDELDEEALVEQTRLSGDLSVLGVMCDAARLRNPSPQFDRIISQCPPNERMEVFFHRVARSPVAARLAEEQALELFRRWNFLSNEVRYLGDEVPDATTPERSRVSPL